MEDHCQELQAFMEENETLFQNQLVQSFLTQNDNITLLKNAICSPSAEHEQSLDDAFKAHHFKVRFLSYISSVLYFNAVNFDKKQRTNKHRFPLTLDQPLSKGEEGLTHKDLIKTDKGVLEHLHWGSIEDALENESLIKAVRKLTEKQRELLYLVYVLELTDTEVAKLTGKSQQAVSKMHKQALNKLRNWM